ncbi:MAG TPA: glycosyltransferase, partial [Myxococcota bacterium]|nr:glycosyltransferase [Myxococcota bacterium]
MRLHVILINYRTPDLTLRALESVLADAPEGTRVALVENDSRDGSDDVLARAIEARGWGDRVVLSASPRNGGFSYGVNRGAEI